MCSDTGLVAGEPRTVLEHRVAVERIGAVELRDVQRIARIRLILRRVSGQAERLVHLAGRERHAELQLVVRELRVEIDDQRLRLVGLRERAVRVRRVRLRQRIVEEQDRHVEASTLIGLDARMAEHLELAVGARDHERPVAG